MPCTAHHRLRTRSVCWLRAVCPIPFLTSNVLKLGYFEEELQLALSTIRTLRNAGLAAINRLPQEVLALIPTHFDPKTPRDTLTASHVCRYWRAALMSSPTLWAIMDTTCMIPPLTLLYLDRSRASPLDITLGVKTPEYILQQFVDRAPQIRLLSFEMVPWHRWKAISERFSASALYTLLNLRISVSTRFGSKLLDSAQFPHASNLRHLFIQIAGPGAPIFPHIRFPSLTTIQITWKTGYTITDRSSAISIHPVTLGHLLDTLRSSPLLEDVSITLHGLILVPRPGASYHPVPLPRLRDFFITCSHTPFPLLTSFDFPPTACVLARTGREGECPSRDRMFSLGQRLSPLISGSDELIFYSSDAFVFTLRFNRGGETRVQFEYLLMNPPMSLEQSLTFLEACSLDTIRRFAIGGRRVRRDVTNDQVSGTMRNLTNIETLLLGGCLHILPLLLPAVQGGRLPCPTLKTLAIDDNQDLPLQKLIQVLRVRAEAGFPLERVVLRAWHFERVPSELRQFVENVECGLDADFRI